MAKPKEQRDLLELLPVLDSGFSVSTLREVADHFEVKRAEVSKWKSAGMPVLQRGGYDLCEIGRWLEEHVEEFQPKPIVLESVQEVSDELAVNRRTIAEWKSKGMPVTSEGKYDLDSIMEWVNDRDKKRGLQPRYGSSRANTGVPALEEFYELANARGQVRAEGFCGKIAMLLDFGAMGETLAEILSMVEGTPTEIREIAESLAYSINLMNRRAVKAAYCRADELANKQQPRTGKRKR